MTTATSSLSLTVPGLTVHYAEGPLRPMLLLPDAGRDATSWQDVAIRLNQAGHAVAALDLRRPDLDGAADDVAHLVDVLDLRGPRAPIVVGHGQGGAVALSLAARRGGVAGVACVAGGWSRPTSAPGSSAAADPRAWFPLIGVPTLLCVALPAGQRQDRLERTRAEVGRALERLPGESTRVSWYAGPGDDLPAAIISQEAARLSEDLLWLAERAEPGPADPRPLRAMPGRAPGYLPLLPSVPWLASCP